MQSLLTLALRNVVRQRRRSAAELLAVSLGVASILLAGGFVRDIFDQLAEAIIRSGVGHLQVAKQGYFAHGSRSPEQYLIDEPDRWAAQIAAQPGVTSVSRRIVFSGLLSNGRSDLAVAVEGIEPEQEARLGTFVRVEQGRRLEKQDQFGAAVGEGVAQSLKIRPGSAVNLVVSTAGGAMNAMDLQIVAVQKSFSREYDARAVQVPLPAAQQLLATAGVNALVVSLAETGSSPAATQALRAALEPHGLEVRSWRQISDFYDSAAELYARQFGILQLIILLMVLLGVVNTVSGTIFERTGEFGTMRALGNRDRGVLAVILVEGVILGTVGSLLGVAVGSMIAAAVSYVGIPMPPPPSSDFAYVARITVEPSLILRAFLIGLVATILGTAPAAIRASRIPVAEALRKSQAF